MTIAYETRSKLAANGYDCVPLIGKRPVLSGWQKKIGAGPQDFDYWDTSLSKAQNTGLNSRRTPGIDLDIVNPEAATMLGDSVRDWFDGRGVVLTRVGQPPKRLIPFRTTAPFSKILRIFRDPADKSGKPQRIEFLGDGQQYVAAGVHPDTGAPYHWHADRSPETTPRDELPEITENEATELVNYLTTMLMEKFGFEEVAASETCHAAPNGHDTNGSPFDPDACLQSMTPDGGSVQEVQRRVILSRLQHGHYPQDILDEIVDHTMKVAEAAGLGWSRDNEIAIVKNRISEAYKTATAKWTSGIPPWLPGEFHVDWMRVEAQGLKPMLARNAYGWFIRREGKAAANGNSGDEENNRQRKSKRPHLGDFALESWQPVNELTLPPREFLYGKHYQRGIVCGTVAPGGSGKTSQAMVEGIAMATCRDLLGEQPTERVRVWYHNAEDTQDEVNRRVVAICKQYKIPQEELTEWFFATSCEKFDLKVAEGASELRVDEKLIDAITQKVQTLRVDVMILDPLVNLHTVPEGDNTKMSAVIGLFRTIAQAEECSIEIEQHTRKMPVGISIDLTGADARGASSVRDALRSQRVLNAMTKEEAKKHQIPEHEAGLYFRVDIGKSNNARPKDAVWRKIIGVELLNGDNVGVVTNWNAPGQGPDTPERLAAQAKAEELFLHLLDKFAGQGRTVSDRKKSDSYAPAMFATQSEARGAKVPADMLAAAMDRLFEKKAIKITTTGSGNHKARVIVLGEGGMCWG